MGTKGFLISALLLGSGAALAADDTVERARRCASELDSLQRLMCYDRVFAPGPTASVAPPGAAAPGAAPVVSLPTAPAAAAPDIASVVAPAKAPRATNETFGSDQLRRAPSELEQDGTPRSLTASVAELRETRPNVFRITLDNGQVWQQMDMDTLFHLQVGDTVEISRGKMGGYRMARQNRGGSGWVRANRIK